MERIVKAFHGQTTIQKKEKMFSLESFVEAMLVNKS